MTLCVCVCVSVRVWGSNSDLSGCVSSAKTVLFVCHKAMSMFLATSSPHHQFLGVLAVFLSCLDAFQLQRVIHLKVYTANSSCIKRVFFYYYFFVFFFFNSRTSDHLIQNLNQLRVAGNSLKLSICRIDDVIKATSPHVRAPPPPPSRPLAFPGPRTPIFFLPPPPPPPPISALLPL